MAYLRNLIQVKAGTIFSTIVIVERFLLSVGCSLGSGVIRPTFNVYVGFKYK